MQERGANPDAAPRRDPLTAIDAAAMLALREILRQSRHASLAWADPEDGTPGISRLAFALDPVLGPLGLVSGLAQHTRALKASAACALMLGDVAAKGDPMTHPRLMLRATAEILPGSAAQQQEIAGRWRARQPKAQIYLNLPDFSFVIFRPLSGLFNAGFGRAFRLGADDLTPSRLHP